MGDHTVGDLRRFCCVVGGAPMELLAGFPYRVLLDLAMTVEDVGLANASIKARPVARPSNFSIGVGPNAVAVSLEETPTKSSTANSGAPLGGSMALTSERGVNDREEPCRETPQKRRKMQDTPNAQQISLIGATVLKPELAAKKRAAVPHEQKASIGPDMAPPPLQPVPQAEATIPMEVHQCRNREAWLAHSETMG